MDRKIDHDEEDRDSSEYEEMGDDDEEEFEEHPKEQQVVLQEIPAEEFQPEYLEEQEPTSSGGHVPMNIEYEEVYPHNASEKVYYENEMEDLVYHEIYGEGNDQQKIGSDKRIRNIVGSSATCLVCQRSESEKIRLFKWPKSEDLREQWLHFFRLPSNVLNSVQDAYICCYHFSADTFVMMDDRIFWKMTAVPKYRHRRPGLSEPFPWEPNASKQLNAAEQQMLSSSESLGYKIRYRLPYMKHKTRSVHQVAVMIPVAQPHLYYEFHFNRPGLHNTKFYACLNCRKAKSESGIRDVIRTIHLDGNKFLSSGDPFNGHHFACRPHNIYDYKSSWRPIPGSNAEAHFLDEVVYVDERGNSLEWDTVTRPGDEAKFEQKEPSEEQIYETFEHQQPICEQVQEEQFPMEEVVEEGIEEAPVLRVEYSEHDQIVEEEEEPEKPLRKRATRMKCHLCPKSNFSSTPNFILHLQKHVSDEKSCKTCSKKISCDSRTVCIRRGFCEQCISV